MGCGVNPNDGSIVATRDRRNGVWVCHQQLSLIIDYDAHWCYEVFAIRRQFLASILDINTNHRSNAEDVGQLEVLPEPPDENRGINPLAISLHPERWESDGLYSDDGISLVQALERLPGIEEMDLEKRGAVVAAQTS